MDAGVDTGVDGSLNRDEEVDVGAVFKEMFRNGLLCAEFPEGTGVDAGVDTGVDGDLNRDEEVDVGATAEVRFRNGLLCTGFPSLEAVMDVPLIGGFGRSDDC